MDFLWGKPSIKARGGNLNSDPDEAGISDASYKS
jgi:hypothetical protein